MSSTRLACGIVGLPNVGKSTLFNALTASGAEIANYPFCTIDPNTGIVEVNDPRLQILSDLSKSKKIIPAIVEFVDIAGLVKGASKGEGLGNKFLTNIRETDAIVQVVRCFDSDEIIHVAGKVDPIADIETIQTELLLADLQTIESLLPKIEKQAKMKKELLLDVAVLTKASKALQEGIVLRRLELTEEEKAALEKYLFLTNKKVLYVCNVSDADLPHLHNEWVAKVEELAKKEGAPVVTICAKLEAEIAALPKEMRREFLREMGLEQSGLDRLVKASFDLLGLICFITAGEIETRAWTILKGTTAQEAAGKIHSDIEKGFIRAEVVTFEEMVACGGRARAREAGKARSEGKEYVVKDGDVILFMHNG